MLLFKGFVGGLELSLQRLDLAGEEVILGLCDVLAGGCRRDRGHIRNPNRDQPVVSMADGGHDRRVRGEDCFRDPLGVECLKI